MGLGHILLTTPSGWWVELVRFSSCAVAELALLTPWYG